MFVRCGVFFEIADVCSVLPWITDVLGVGYFF